MTDLIANFGSIWPGWSFSDAWGLLKVGLAVATIVFCIIAQRQMNSAEKDVDEGLRALLESALAARDAGVPIEPADIELIENIIASRQPTQPVPLGPKFN